LLARGRVEPSKKEALLIKATTELGACQVRSGTDRPCPRPAVVKIRGIPFCEPCAREQEAYFAIGELTEAPRRLGSEPLVELLDRVRRTSAGRGGTHADEPDAA
jgi:hypothetical protein